MYLEALRERRRLQVPLLWAQTQNNLGLALWSLGESTDDVKRLRQASRAFHRALTERTRERTATDWAETQNNLGAVLWSLGQHATGNKELEQAVQAYNDALSVYSERTGTVMEVARTRRNLGNALAALGKRRSDLSQLEDALEHLRASLSVHDPEREPIQWAEIQGDIGFVALEIGEHWLDPNCLDHAKCAFGEAASAYQKAKMNRHALAFSEQASVTQNLLDQVKESSE